MQSYALGPISENASIVDETVQADGFEKEFDNDADTVKFDF